MPDHFVIREFGTILRKKDYAGLPDTFDCIYLADKPFDLLKDFISENVDPANNIEMAFSASRSKGRDRIKVGNMVGAIEISDGTTIEVLPKIHLAAKSDQKESTRRIFLRMLRCLRDSPFKTIDQAHLKTSRFPVLEVFITSYLGALSELIYKGLKQHYVFQEENARFLKGKLNFADHLRENLFRRERFHISFDEFSLNIPQNKIIKSTLIFLSGKSKNSHNKLLIHNYISLFESIDASDNFIRDLWAIESGSNRLYSHYDQVLKWSRVFLMGESFTNFKGKSLNMAILYPMEKIFEDYVGARIKSQNPDDDVSLQDRSHFLVEQHQGTRRFRIRPDIVVRRGGSVHYVLDTKWKEIDGSASLANYNISQADMYQLYAYGKKYRTPETGHPKLVLIYPRNPHFIEPLKFLYEDTMELFAIPWDLEEDSMVIPFRV